MTQEIRAGGTSLHSSTPPTKAQNVVADDPTHRPEPAPATAGGGHARRRNKLTLFPLIFLIFFEVAGGPYGAEPAVQAVGPLFALLGFLVFPFVWAVPESLVTAELSTAMPGNGGYVVWVDRAFGPFAGSLMGTWKYVCSAISAAAFPALCTDYLKRVVPAVSHGGARVATIVTFNVALSLPNYTGLSVVGWTAVALGLLSLSPFFLMSGMAVPKILPHRWGVTAGEKDWKVFLNTLFWNLNYWDSVSTMAGEVERPGRTFPLALVSAVCMASLGYLVPLMAATGAIDAPPEAWGNGYLADAAGAYIRPRSFLSLYCSCTVTLHATLLLLTFLPASVRALSHGKIIPVMTSTAWRLAQKVIDGRVATSGVKQDEDRPVLSHKFGARLIAGRWLKYWIEVGAVLSSIGLYSATLSSAAFLLLGMADLGLLPAFLAVRSPVFNTPWASIAVTGAIALGMSFFSFNSIVTAANFLYNLGMLLELAAFVWLRVRCPKMPRPYRVPVATGGAVAMCAVPAVFLALIMAIAGWKVYVTSAAFTVHGAVVYYLVAFCKARPGDALGSAGQGLHATRRARLAVA